MAWGFVTSLEKKIQGVSIKFLKVDSGEKSGGGKPLQYQSLEMGEDQTYSL